MEYTVEYFIAKFEAIPEEKWWVGSLQGPDGVRCALGHCGARSGHFTVEAQALNEVFGAKHARAVDVNDDTHQEEFTGATPKARILNLLRAIKYEKDEMAYVDKNRSPLPALATV